MRGRAALSTPQAPKVPCIFPTNREKETETGSPMTASIASLIINVLKADAPEIDIFYDDTWSYSGDLDHWRTDSRLRPRLDEGTMMLGRTGLGLLVGAILVAPSVASAAPALVFEPYSGTVVYSEDADAQWFPASLTKLMTAYVAFQALKAGTVTPDTKVICSQTAAVQAPSKLGLPIGGSITLDVALKVLIVKSANDVAVMVAEAVAGSQDAFI